MRELREGRMFTLPDGRVGKIGRCRACGAEVVFPFPTAAAHRSPPFDFDGELHRQSCADSEQE